MDKNTNPPKDGTDGTDGAQAGTRQVMMHRIYCRDASLEIPHAPQVFNQAWTPQVDVQVGTQIDSLGNDLYNVTLTLTVTAKSGEDVAYLVEVKQAGIFAVFGFANDAETQAVLGVYCPNAIFPFAREVVADLIQRASFPQLLLQPINFEVLYAQHLAQNDAGAPQSRIVLN